ncbi:hypothetical protein Tco_0764258 [Tanacetum coccineum]
MVNRYEDKLPNRYQEMKWAEVCFPKRYEKLSSKTCIPLSESDDYDSEGNDNSTSLPEFESFHVDYRDSGDSTIDVVEDIPVDVPNILPTDWSRASSCDSNSTIIITIPGHIDIISQVQSPQPIHASIPTPTPISKLKPDYLSTPLEPRNGSQTNQADNGECNCEVSQEGEEAGRDFEMKECGFCQTLKRKETEESSGEENLDVLYLVFQEEVDAGAKEVNTAEGVNTGSIKLSTVSEQVSTGKDASLAEASQIGYFTRTKRGKRQELKNRANDQSQLKTYMMNYLKNQGTWKLSQLKNLSFEEVKEEFDKLVKQVESFAPINFEATKASLKRFGEELQTKTTKRQKDEDVKDVEPTKKSGKRRETK